MCSFVNPHLQDGVVSQELEYQIVVKALRSNTLSKLTFDDAKVAAMRDGVLQC